MFTYKTNSLTAKSIFDRNSNFSSRFLAGHKPTPQQWCRLSASRARANAWSTRRTGRRAKHAGWRSVWPWACRRAVRGTAVDPTGLRCTACSVNGHFYPATSTMTAVVRVKSALYRHRCYHGHITHVSHCSRYRYRSSNGHRRYSNFSVSRRTVGPRYHGPSGRPSARQPFSDP